MDNDGSAQGAAPDERLTLSEGCGKRKQKDLISPSGSFSRGEATRDYSALIGDRLGSCCSKSLLLWRSYPKG